MSGLRRSDLLLVSVALVIGACGAGEASSPDTTTTSTTTDNEATTSTAPSETTTMPQLDPDQTTLIEAATADLAARIGVDPALIGLVTFKDVTWPDGSLGCPEPGMSYTQALVEGYQIVLRHGDRLFDYHGADDGQPFLCKSEEKDGGHEFVPPPGFDE
jgi:hypothetical protein